MKRKVKKEKVYGKTLMEVLKEIASDSDVVFCTCPSKTCRLHPR